jgi:transcriptional regulator with XRE-family HTH domain
MPNDVCLKLGKQIRDLRGKHKLTQEELASRANISTKYLQNLEGKKPKVASLVTLEKLAKGFGVPLWELLRTK